VRLESLDGLGPRHAGLRHDEVDVAGLYPRVVNLLLLVGRQRGVLPGHGLAEVLHPELLRGLGLQLGAEVLDLSLAEYHVRLRRRALEHVGLGHHEQYLKQQTGMVSDDGEIEGERTKAFVCLFRLSYVLGSFDGYPADAGDGFHSELHHGLAALLLAPALLGTFGCPCTELAYMAMDDIPG
jgi:hypothetical protein